MLQPLISWYCHTALDGWTLLQTLLAMPTRASQPNPPVYRLPQKLQLLA
jgi:hypothetical protein